jgi:hypothetical protein
MSIQLPAPDGADDFSQWELSNLKLEGVPAISGSLSKDRRTYVAKFPKEAVARIDLAQSSKDEVVDLTVTGNVTHNDTQSSFGVGAAVRQGRDRPRRGREAVEAAGNLRSLHPAVLP